MRRPARDELLLPAWVLAVLVLGAALRLLLGRPAPAPRAAAFVCACCLAGLVVWGYRRWAAL